MNHSDKLRITIGSGVSSVLRWKRTALFINKYLSVKCFYRQSASPASRITCPYTLPHPDIWIEISVSLSTPNQISHIQSELQNILSAKLFSITFVRYVWVSVELFATDLIRSMSTVFIYQKKRSDMKCF